MILLIPTIFIAIFVYAIYKSLVVEDKQVTAFRKAAEEYIANGCEGKRPRREDFE